MCIKLTGSAHENCLHPLLIFSLFVLFLVGAQKTLKFQLKVSIPLKKSQSWVYLALMAWFYLKKYQKNIFFSQKVQNFTIFKNRGTGTTYIRVPEKCTSYMLKRLFYRYKYHK